jgi:hypothetical protein
VKIGTPGRTCARRSLSWLRGRCVAMCYKTGSNHRLLVCGMCQFRSKNTLYAQLGVCRQENLRLCRAFFFYFRPSVRERELASASPNRRCSRMAFLSSWLSQGCSTVRHHQPPSAWRPRFPRWPRSCASSQRRSPARLMLSPRLHRKALPQRKRPVQHISRSGSQRRVHLLTANST